MSGVLGLLIAMKAAAAASTTTLDPATIGTNGALSGGNLVWTGTAASNANARSVASHSTGKYYCELTVTAWDSTNYHLAVGVMNASESMNGNMGTTNSVQLNIGGDANIYNNGNLGSIGVTTIQGDILGMAVDVGAGKIWFRGMSGGTAWSNGGIGDPVAGTGGTTITVAGALYAAIQTQGVGNAVTCNFGATTYNIAAPSGYSNW